MLNKGNGKERRGKHRDFREILVTKINIFRMILDLEKVPKMAHFCKQAPPKYLCLAYPGEVSPSPEAKIKHPPSEKNVQKQPGVGNY